MSLVHLMEIIARIDTKDCAFCIARVSCQSVHYPGRDGVVLFISAFISGVISFCGSLIIITNTARTSTTIVLVFRKVVVWFIYLSLILSLCLKCFLIFQILRRFWDHYNFLSRFFLIKITWNKIIIISKVKKNIVLKQCLIYHQRHRRISVVTSELVKKIFSMLMSLFALDMEK